MSDKNQQATAATNGMHKNKKKQYQLLIVDDDDLILELYATRFLKEGFDVVTSQKGKDALSKLREGFDPDIMMVDIRMPEMDGLAFLEQTQKEGLATKAKILVISNQEKERNQEKMQTLNVSDYIEKVQLSPQEVVDRVTSLLEE